MIRMILFLMSTDLVLVGDAVQIDDGGHLHDGGGSGRRRGQLLLQTQQVGRLFQKLLRRGNGFGYSTLHKGYTKPVIPVYSNHLKI